MRLKGVINLNLNWGMLAHRACEILDRTPETCLYRAAVGEGIGGTPSRDYSHPCPTAMSTTLLIDDCERDTILDLVLQVMGGKPTGSLSAPSAPPRESAPQTLSFTPDVGDGVAGADLFTVDLKVDSGSSRCARATLPYASFID